MSELQRILRLAGPIVLAQLGQMLLGVVDAAYAGHLSTAALGAVTLGNLWQLATALPLVGVVMGLDPLVSQAHGAGRGEQAGLALQRALLIACVLSLPVCLSWIYAEEGLILLRQDGALAHAAAVYTRAQVFSAPFMLIHAGLGVYLTSRGIVRPGVITMAIANLFNAFMAYGLIFGHFGLPRWGIWGGGLATGLTRLLLPFLLAGIILSQGLQRGASRKLQRDIFEPAALFRQLALGAPMGLTLALELWAFQFGTLLAGRLGPLALAAHSIALSLSSLSFMVPLGLSIAASARVGALIGARKPEEAQHSAHAALKLALGYALLAGSTFALARGYLPRLYSKDHATLALAAGVLPIAGAFQVMDSLQAVGGGILRGMGKPRVTAGFNLLGYFALGIPLATYLGLATSTGLMGIWLGYAAGLSVVATGLVCFVLMRGPRSVRPLVG